MKHFGLFILFVLVCGVLAQELRINQIQVLGSHNSYHQAAVPVAWIAPIVAYSHPPVKTQLDLGVRQLEFDIFGFLKKSDFYVGHVPKDFGTSCSTL